MTPYYDDGSITIYHGDCREIVPELDRVDAIVTDPPYGLGGFLAGGLSEWGLHAEADGRRSSSGLSWDDEAPEFVISLPAAADHCIIWGGNYFSLPPRRGWLVWDKINRQFSTGHCELAWTTLDQPVRAFNYATCTLAGEGKTHPTQKPLPLMSWCLAFLPGALSVLDPFMGSGTTLVAAKTHGKRATGIDINEGYCEMAANRLAQGVLDFGGVA